MAEKVNFQQFRFKKMVGLRSGEKIFHFGKTVLLWKKKYFRGETFFFRKGTHFGHFLLKKTLVNLNRDEFSKVKHFNSAYYIVFFLRKRPNVTIFLPNENGRNG